MKVDESNKLYAPSQYDAWEQLVAGVRLVEWSNLASMDKTTLRFSAPTQDEFEAGNKAVDPVYGRLIRWIVFSVGVEYLAKGVLSVKGEKLLKDTNVLRAPNNSESVMEWVQKVISNDADVLVESFQYGRKLGEIPFHQHVQKQSSALVQAAFQYFTRSIRNRDVHRYAKDVRAAHFGSVPSVFIPALNALLASVPQAALESHLT